MSLILGLAAAATTLPQVYAENRQHVEDGSAAAVADCDLNNIEEADFHCIASAASEEGVISDSDREPPPELTEPQTCLECFLDILSPEEIDVLTEGGQQSLHEICQILMVGDVSPTVKEGHRLDIAGVNEDKQDALIECLEAVGIMFVDNNNNNDYSARTK